MDLDIISTLKSCKRVLKVATKPSKEEYWKTLKVTSLGVLLIGAIGFAIFMVFALTPLG